METKTRVLIAEPGEDLRHLLAAHIEEDEGMELAGADRFVTMDLHAQQLQGFFKNPMDHLYAQPMLKEVISRVGTDNMVVVSPDAGYAKQARKFAEKLDDKGLEWLMEVAIDAGNFEAIDALDEQLRARQKEDSPK